MKKYLLLIFLIILTIFFFSLYLIDIPAPSKLIIEKFQIKII